MDTVELGTLKFDANFWIMDMVPNLIIGLDVCKKQGIKLDIPTIDWRYREEEYAC